MFFPPLNVMIKIPCKPSKSVATVSASYENSGRVINKKKLYLGLFLLDNTLEWENWDMVSLL